MKRNIILNSELISLFYNLKKLALDCCGKDWKSFRAETSSQKSHGIGKAKLEEAFDTSLHIAFKKGTYLVSRLCYILRLHFSCE